MNEKMPAQKELLSNQEQYRRFLASSEQQQRALLAQEQQQEKSSKSTHYSQRRRSSPPRKATPNTDDSANARPSTPWWRNPSYRMGRSSNPSSPATSPEPADAMVGRRKQVDQSRENTFLLSTLQNPYPNPYTKLYLASPEQVAREWSQEQLADTASRLGRSP